MSFKEVIDLLNDLMESHKQIALRLKLIELEIISLKENIPGRTTNIMEKIEKFDKIISQKYLNNLLAKKVASISSYQKGSMDEKLINEFLEKNKIDHSKTNELEIEQINPEKDVEESNHE